MNVRPSLLLSLLVPSALLAGSAVAATRTGSNSPASLPATGTATAPVACAGETATPAGLVFGDVDGDGLDDAFVVGAEGQARLLMNFGEGRFEDVTLAANLAELGGATCALFADLDGDGRVDLFAGSSEHRLWKNLGNATFEPMASGIEHDLVDLAAQAVDRDQDGRLDLQIHTEAGDLVYRNLGEGRFERLALPLGELPQTHVGWIAPDSMDATDPLAAPDAGTPAQRRLGRWVQGRAAGGFASTATGAPSGSSSFGTPLPFIASCQPGVRDANGGACIGASSVPTLGKLYPLSSNLFVTPSGRVGVGTTTPAEKLQIVGTSEESFIDLRTNGAFNAGIKMRSLPLYGWDMQHEENGGGGLNFRRWDADFSAAGASALYLDRKRGSVGIGTAAPDTAFALDIEDVGSGISWKGSIAAGRSTGQKVVLGQHLGVATIGGHTGALNAWTNLSINPVGGNVGIGTASPTRRLSVTGSVANDGLGTFDNPNAAGFSGVYFEENGAPRGWIGHVNSGSAFAEPGTMQIGSQFHDLAFSVSSDQFFVERVRITNAGNVGIGTAAPAFKLEVNGTAGKPGGGSWSVSSDRRLKKNVASLEGALDTLLALRGVSFEYIDPEAAHELPGTRVGFIAQEVEEVLPDWVEEIDGYKRLTVRGFEALAVEAFREQGEKIEAQREEIANLRTRVAELENLHSEIETLKTSLAALAAR